MGRRVAAAACFDIFGDCRGRLVFRADHRFLARHGSVARRDPSRRDGGDPVSVETNPTVPYRPVVTLILALRIAWCISRQMIFISIAIALPANLLFWTYRNDAQSYCQGRDLGGSTPGIVTSRPLSRTTLAKASLFRRGSVARFGRIVSRTCQAGPLNISNAG